MSHDVLWRTAIFYLQILEAVTRYYKNVFCVSRSCPSFPKSSPWIPLHIIGTTSPVEERKEHRTVTSTAVKFGSCVRHIRLLRPYCKKRAVVPCIKDGDQSTASDKEQKVPQAGADMR
jgi:hypothetical protein